MPWVSNGEKQKACQVRSPYSPNLCNDGREPTVVTRKEIDVICKKLFWIGSDASVQGKCIYGGLASIDAAGRARS
jgi:hypothetical protein